MGTTRGKMINKSTKTKAEVSKLLKIAPQELTEFEAEGLFEFADKARQIINESNIERIRVAKALKEDLGVNIAGIEVVLNMRDKMLRMKKDMNTLLVQMRHKMAGKVSENLGKIKKEME